MRNILFILAQEKDDMPWFCPRCKKDRKPSVYKIKGMKTLRRRSKISKRAIKYMTGTY